MKKENKWGIRIVCVLTGLLMAVGCYAIAAEYGSQSDPLVTLSYINEVLLPQTKSELDEKLAQTVSSYDQTLQQKTQELEQYVDRQVRNYSSGQLDSTVIDQIAAAVVQQMGGASGGSAVWAVVQIPAGGRVSCAPARPSARPPGLRAWWTSAMRKRWKTARGCKPTTFTLQTPRAGALPPPRAALC